MMYCVWSVGCVVAYVRIWLHVRCHYVRCGVIVCQYDKMPLHLAAEKGDAKCVELLLEAKAPVDAKTKVPIMSVYAYRCPAVMLEDHCSFYTGLLYSSCVCVCLTGLHSVNG